jgi:WD40 repeat protein
MAMEFRLSVPDVHTKTITSIQYNSFRREIYTAGEDSLIRVWEAESGKPVATWAGHTGWVTALLYCKEIKILFSSSIDGSLIAWGPSGKAIQKVQVWKPSFLSFIKTAHTQLYRYVK